MVFRLFYRFDAIPAMQLKQRQQQNKHSRINTLVYDTRVDNGKYLNIVLTICHIKISDSIFIIQMHVCTKMCAHIKHIRLATMYAVRTHGVFVYYIRIYEF